MNEYMMDRLISQEFIKRDRNKLMIPFYDSNPLLKLLRKHYNSLDEAVRCIEEATKAAGESFYNHDNLFHPDNNSQFDLKNLLMYFITLKFKKVDIIFKEKLWELMEILSYSILCVWDIDVFYGEYMQYLKVFKGID